MRSKNAHVVPPPIAQQPTHQYPQNQGYGPPQPSYGQTPPQMPPHQVPAQQPPVPNAAPTLTNAISSLDGPALQKLLGSLNQTPQNQQQQAPQGPPQQQSQLPQDLAALLSSVTRQTPQQQSPGYQQPPTPTQGYPYQIPPQQQQQYPQQGQQGPNSGYANNQVLSQLLSRVPPQPGALGSQPQGGQPTYQGISPQQQQPVQQQNVQDIMAQLAKYRG